MMKRRTSGVMSTQCKAERLNIFARRPNIRSENAGSTKSGRRKTQTGSEEVPTGSQFSVIIVERMVKSHENAGERGIIGEKRMEL